MRLTTLITVLSLASALGGHSLVHYLGEAKDIVKKVPDQMVKVASLQDERPDMDTPEKSVLETLRDIPKYEVKPEKPQCHTVNLNQMYPYYRDASDFKVNDTTCQGAEH